MSLQEEPRRTRLIMEERKKLTLTGATEVLRFDEGFVELNTVLGPVAVEGAELKLKCLSLDDGTLVITGNIRSFSYEEPTARRRLFR